MMRYTKQKFLNNSIKQINLKLFIVTISFLFFLPIIVGAGSKKHTVTLPQKISGIEKIEYLINGVPQGNTSGNGSITINELEKLNLLIKFEDKGYSSLKAGDIKIVTDSGENLDLNVYKYDKKGNIITQKVSDDEFIDSSQTYVTSDKYIMQDETFRILGIKQDTYKINLSFMNSEGNICDALNIKYQTQDNSVNVANFNEESNSFEISNLNYGSYIKVWAELEKPYTQSNLSFYLNDTYLNKVNEMVYVPALTSNMNIKIDGLQKNSYNLEFKSSSGCEFNSVEDNSVLDKVSNITHGKDFYFKCSSIAKDMEVVANDVVIRPKNGIYKLESVLEDTVISVVNKDRSLYPIYFNELSSIAYVTDLSGNRVSNATVSYGENFSFKIVAKEGYTQNENKISLYAVPDRLQDLSQEELNSYLITPSTEGIYDINNIVEPVRIFFGNAIKNTYRVQLPDKLIGADYEIIENDDIQRVADNEVILDHGTPLEIRVNPKLGYDTSDLKFNSEESNLKVNKSGDIYKISGINASTDIVIWNIKELKCTVSFDISGCECFDVNNQKIDSPILVSYNSDELKFWIDSKDAAPNISVQGDAKLKEPEENDKFYTLYEVKSDAIVSIKNEQKKPVTVNLLSIDDDLEFKSNDESNKVLSKENVLTDDSDFQFQVYSKNGQIIEDADVNSVSGVSISKISSDPLTYSVSGVSEETNIFVSKRSSVVSPLAQNEDRELLCPAAKIKFIYERSDVLRFENENGGTVDELDLKYEKDPETGEYKLNHRILPVSLKGSQYYDTTEKKYELHYYTDAEFNEEISTDKFGMKVSEIKEGSNVNIIMSLADIEDGKIDFDINNADHYSTIEGSNGKKYYCMYDTIYIKLKPINTKNFNVKLPQADGISFYKVDHKGEILGTDGMIMGYEVIAGDKVTDTIPVTDSDHFDFIVRIDDAYEWTSLKILGGDDVASLTKQINIITSENRNLYTISDVYSNDVTISVEGLKKKQFNVDFSSSVGTVFYKMNGETFSSEYIHTAPYGDEFEFYTLSRTGFNSQVKSFTLILNNKYYYLDLPDETTGPKYISTPEVKIEANYYELDKGKKSIRFKLSEIKSNFDIRVVRDREVYSVRFPAIKGIRFRDLITNEVIENGGTIQKTFESSVSFSIESDESIDINNISVSANGNHIERTNNRYVISKISRDVDIDVTGYTSSRNNVILTTYDGITYKDSSNETINTDRIEISYGSNFEFSVALSEFIANSNITLQAEGLSSGNITKLNRNPATGKYVLEDIKEDYKIVINGIEISEVSIEFYKTEGLNYYNQYGTEKLASKEDSGIDTIVQTVKYGDSFSFRIVPDNGIDTSSLVVWYKRSATDRSPVQISPDVNNVYTVENISGPYIIYTSSVSKLNYEVEVRTTEGVKCLDTQGNTISSKVSVSSGSNFSFRLSIENTYNKSDPIVEVKGSLNHLTPDADGVYTLENINENKIIDIRNITKNTYRVTFKPAEGVVYKTIKNKPFTDYLDVEYGSALQFKISLKDAYDESIPSVLLNGNEAVAGSGGVYSVQNINSDVEISVENVVKNAEDITIDKILTVPTEISSSSDVDRVVDATKVYNELTDEQKSLVTNLDELESAQRQSESINHSAENISVTGIEWNIKLVVIPLNEDKSAIEELNAELDRKSLLTLYEIKLYDMLTGESYDVPYGKEVSVTMPCPDLSQYQNVVVVHKNSGGGIEYLDANIQDNMAQFKTTSFSRFGIAAKKIPNYSENPSDVTISVGDLVENEEELESLLGEGVSSQLGELITLEDTSSSDKENGDNKESGETNNESSKTFFDNIYNWAINNEFIAVIIVLLIGLLIIGLILLIGKKKK